MEEKQSDKVVMIDAAIGTCERERAEIEKKLIENGDILQNLMVEQRLGEHVEHGQLDDVRGDIRNARSRIEEIDRTLIGLRARRATEEKKIVHEKMLNLTRLINEAELSIYRIYRELKVHEAAFKKLNEDIGMCNIVHNELSQRINAIGGNRCTAFSVNPSWYTYGNATESDQRVRQGGLMPWDPNAGPIGDAFINDEIARLEKESAK